MRVQVYGYGSMGRRHAANARDLGHEVAVDDASEAARERAWADGFMVARLRSADAAVIATPASTHAPLFWDALATARRCLVEKPLAMSMEDFVLRRPGQRHADYVSGDYKIRVGYSMRFHAGVAAVREGLARAGRPVAARFHVSCNKGTWPGGSYADAILECSHEVDLAFHLLGPGAVAAALASHGARVWDLILTHDSGVTSTVHVDDRYDGYRRGGSVDGEAGTVAWMWDAPEDRFTVRAEDQHRGECTTVMEHETERAYRAEMAGFLGDAPDVGATAMDGLRVLTAVDSARRISLPLQRPAPTISGGITTEKTRTYGREKS